MASETLAVSETSVARSEPTISKSHVYTDLHSFQLDTSVEFVKSYDLSGLLQDYIEGCGRVDLVKIGMKIRTTAKGQTINVGVADSASSLDALGASMKPNGFSHCSNDRNYGEQMNIEILPEDTLSMQIRPISAMLPSMKLLIAVSKDVKVSLHVYYKISGVRHRYNTLK